MNHRPFYPAAKRAFDATASAAGLVLLSPLLAAAALAVKASSPGPVLFRQERMGRGGIPFRLLKFRTMRVGGAGPEVTVAGDRRVTGVGRFLRRYKVDELPQLINVVRGDMSLVGPRPEVRRYVERFPEDYRRILALRPGITDLAAIEFRDEESILAGATNPEHAYVASVLPAKIKLYDEYIRRMSFATDLSILGRTLLAILRGP